LWFDDLGNNNEMWAQSKETKSGQIEGVAEQGVFS
jgi:hypothetical protein